jgi:hypothetical protein
MYDVANCSFPLAVVWTVLPQNSSLEKPVQWELTSEGSTFGLCLVYSFVHLLFHCMKRYTVCTVCEDLQLSARKEWVFLFFNISISLYEIVF